MSCTVCARVRHYFWNILVAKDQLWNAITGGDPDETISSRAGKQHSWLAVHLCKFLSLFDKRHCEKSIELDEGEKVQD